MSKKVLAVVLALVMVIGCVPFIALADDGEAASYTAAEKTSAWKENFAPVLEELTSNESSAHWKYVAENNENLSRSMLTYTIFALYDDAWKNGFDKSVSVETAEQVLVSLIEKIDANIGESKFHEILEVLKTASDINDLLQKVNSYVEISDVLTSSEWNTAFKYINSAIKLGNLYEKERDDVIEAYAKILSVQAANEYYKDFLNYVASVTSYDVVVTACRNLIADIDGSIESLIKGEIAKATGFTASNVLTTAARIAADTNAYTAVALKVYDIGKSAADVLWNTSDQYVLMDQLYTTFFVEAAASSYAKKASREGDAELYEFAIGALLALRQGGAETLYNLKLAQNEGVVGMVKNQINYNVTINEAAELAFLALAKDVLFNTDIATYVPVDSIIQVNTVATVKVGNTKLFGETPVTVSGDDGYFTVTANSAAGTYIKTGFVAAGRDVKIYSDDDALATLILYVIENGIIEDYSFTTVAVGPETSIEFNTAFANGYEYSVVNGGEAEAYSFSADYVYPAYNAVTPSAVASAVGTVVKGEVSELVVSYGNLIENFFNKIIKTITDWINSIKLGKNK